ncbi:MAG: hypothetical protein HY863_07615 [Chloroflexi bacterium]|nr:hypothetical protein [Chloroflexota bacterium]
MKLSLVTLRNIFLGIFILATLVTFIYVYREATIVAENPRPTAPQPAPDSNMVVQLELDKIVPVMASIITSLTTLLGFVFTSVMTLRKEKREARESELALKQKEIELKRALMELEDLKKKGSG